MAAYRAVQADLEPGIACLIGTGGVGRALAFGLIAFGADEIRLVDKDEAKAQALTTELRAIPNAPRITAFADAAQAAVGATGIVNGTPVGMIGYGGSPLSQQAMATAEWAFDAVYTPRNTQFLQDAAARGIKVISGYELFIYQGVHAWSHFAGLPLDETQLRADMLKQEGVA
jgi:shikimate dehydrogenase